MKILEFLDRMGERRAARPQRPLRDIRQFIGFSFLFGYYLVIIKFTYIPLPEGNVDLIRDGMLTLGPPVGLIVGAMFRSDAREEQATANTGEAFRAQRAQAEATAAVASGTGAPNGGHAGKAATEVADAAVDKSDEIKGKK